MHYKLHRVAPNSSGWLKPSNGRLGQAGVGDYVAKHGFGHEDWNFNFDLSSDGRMMGYTAATPSKKTVGERFGLILATYDAGGWRAAGFYDGAEFVDIAKNSVPDAAIERMALDVFQLAAAGHADSRFLSMTSSEIEEVIRTDFVYFCWSVAIENVHVFRDPFAIPKTVFNPGRQRMRVPFDLTEAQFLAITKLGNTVAAVSSDREEEEGVRALKLHLKSERKPSLVRDFKASLSSLECSVCGFDFEEKYGEIGSGFIECHHTKPVSDMKPGDKTKLSELCAVCANCHRMIHRSNPMLTPEGLSNQMQ
jgi:HNH endonuclease